MQQPGEPEVIAQGWICPGPRSANPPKVVYGVDPVTGERTAIVTATFVKYPILDRLKQMAALRDAHRLAFPRLDHLFIRRARRIGHKAWVFSVDLREFLFAQNIDPPIARNGENPCRGGGFFAFK